MSKKKIAFVLSVILSASSLIVNPLSAGEEEDKILAKVGPYSLTRSVFLSQLKSMPPRMQQSMFHTPNFKEKMLDDWVEMTLMAMAAKESRLDQDPLVQAKMENLQHALLAQEYAKRHIEAKVSSSMDDITKYYNEHQKEFEEPEMVRASHILIGIKGDGKDGTAAEEARAKADEVKKRLADGADFAEIAKELSDDTVSGQKGGDLGYFNKGKMAPEFDKAVFALPVGQLSDPIKTKYGFHLIKVMDKVEGKVQELADVQERIARTLEMEQREKIGKEVIEGLKKNHAVTINKDLLQDIKIESAPHGVMGQ